MPFDGFAIKALTKELDSWLVGGRINSIHQPEKDELVLSIRHPMSGTFRLMISANARWARMHTTTSKKPNPQVPPAFCMLLRKYLEGGKIKDFRQIDFERIVHIEIEALDEFREWKSKILICEFMGRHSNIILINPETGVIIDAIKRYGSDVSSYREVLPGRDYVSPPSQNKLNPLQMEYEEFARRMWGKQSDKTLSSALFNICSGISPYSSVEICLSAGLDPECPVEECAEFEFSSIYQKLKDLLTAPESGNNPAVIYKKSQPAEFTPYLPCQGTYDLLDSVNEACDIFYTSKLDSLRLESMKKNLSRNVKSILDKAYKKRFNQEGDLVKARENEKYRVWGELITAYSYQMNKGDTSTILNDFYTGEAIEIKLDPRYTPVQNAQRHFKIYNKSRKAIKHLESLMATNQAEIDYLESVMVAIQQSETPRELDEIVEELENQNYAKKHGKKSQRIKSQPRKYVSTDGLEILVGRNNRQNDILTLKTAERSDLWLHTKNIPGTHVIIRLPKRYKSIHDLPDSTLEEAALLAAHFSKAAQSEKVDVDYTFRNNVKKPAGALPGMVIYENYWTIVVNPQEERMEKLLQSEIKN